MPVDAHRLNPFAVLASLGEDDRAQIAERTHEKEAPPGAELTRSGEFGYHLFFIEHGEVEVLRANTVVASLGPDDHFGEVALFVTGQRTADVRAATPVKLLVVFDRDVRELDKAIPEFGRALRQASGSRMPGAAPSA